MRLSQTSLAGNGLRLPVTLLGETCCGLSVFRDKTIMNEVSDLAVGTAGEHLVCCDLLMKGYRAFLTDQNCPYDVAVEQDGKIIRIQVKSTRKPKRVPQRKHIVTSYFFFTRRAGKKGVRTYNKNDFDVLALVAIDINKIAYMKPIEVAQTILIRTDEFEGGKVSGVNVGKTFSQYPFERVFDNESEKDRDELRKNLSKETKRKYCEKLKKYRADNPKPIGRPKCNPQ